MCLMYMLHGQNKPIQAKLKYIRAGLLGNSSLVGSLVLRNEAREVVMRLLSFRLLSAEIKGV